MPPFPEGTPKIDYDSDRLAGYLYDDGRGKYHVGIFPTPHPIDPERCILPVEKQEAWAQELSKHLGIPPGFIVITKPIRNAIEDVLGGTTIEVFQPVEIETQPCEWDRTSENCAQAITELKLENITDPIQRLQINDVLAEVSAHTVYDSDSLDTSNCNPFAGTSAETLHEVLQGAFYNPRIWQPRMVKQAIIEKFGANPKKLDVLQFVHAEIFRQIKAIVESIKTPADFDRFVATTVRQKLVHYDYIYGGDCDWTASFDNIPFTTANILGDSEKEINRAHYPFFHREIGKLVLTVVEKYPNLCYQDFNPNLPHIYARNCPSLSGHIVDAHLTDNFEVFDSGQLEIREEDKNHLWQQYKEEVLKALANRLAWRHSGTHLFNGGYTTEPKRNKHLTEEEKDFVYEYLGSLFR